MKIPSVAVVVVALALAVALPARTQHLRLLSMWRHVGEDGFAISPCGDSGAHPLAIKIPRLIFFVYKCVSNSAPFSRLPRHARAKSKAIVLRVAAGQRRRVACRQKLGRFDAHRRALGRF
jgi:hypothetical protein